jgi:hypothetical protein
MSDESLVVQVILRPASGRRITGETRITAENFGDYAPSRDDAAVVARVLADAGFDIGPFVGISMSATALAQVIESFFDTRVITSPTDGSYAVWANGEQRRELPLHSLPRSLVDRLEAVTFEPPAEIVGEEELGC